MLVDSSSTHRRNTGLGDIWAPGVSSEYTGSFQATFGGVLRGEICASLRHFKTAMTYLTPWLKIGWKDFLSELREAPCGAGSIIQSQMLQPLHNLHMFLAALRLRVYDGDVGEAELPAVVQAQSSTLHYSAVHYSTVQYSTCSSPRCPSTRWCRCWWRTTRSRRSAGPGCSCRSCCIWIIQYFLKEILIFNIFYLTCFAHLWELQYYYQFSIKYLLSVTFLWIAIFWLNVTRAWSCRCTPTGRRAALLGSCTRWRPESRLPSL